MTERAYPMPDDVAPPPDVTVKIPGQDRMEIERLLLDEAGNLENWAEFKGRVHAAELYLGRAGRFRALADLLSLD